jgi:CspA family cold shock protein
MLGPLGAVQVIHPDDKEKDREAFSEVRLDVRLVGHYQGEPTRQRQTRREAGTQSHGSLKRQPGRRKEVVLSRVRDVPAAGGRKNIDHGTLKWFSPDEGYGYITPDDGGEEIFFSYSATWGGGFRDLQQGDRVSYKTVEGWNGPHAENVSKL